MTRAVNEIVDVITTCLHTHTHKLVPKTMQWQGRLYHFTKLGYRHPSSQGRRLVHVFDMSDSTHAYRLEFDAESLVWRLKYISDDSPD